MQQFVCNKWLWMTLLYLSCISISFGQQRFTPATYIDEYKNVAQQLMLETGVPASVILAIAMHESANGNSRIARYLNNHFGIKGKNNSKAIKSAYKGYESTLASYWDFINLLKRRKSVQSLFEGNSVTDYKPWILAIARSGYSATKDWRHKVLATISRYNLNEYDQGVN